MRGTSPGIFKIILISIVSSLFILPATGWAKTIIAPESAADSPYPISSSTSPLTLLGAGLLFTPEWDWENASTMQVVDSKGVTRNMYPPWHLSAPTDIPLEISLDHRKADGWVLLYNFLDDAVLEDTNGNPFPKKIFTPVQFFALYNKYRGIVRFFYFHDESITYTNFLYALDIAGLPGESTLLNFAEDFAKSDGERLSHPFLQRANIETKGVSGPQPDHWHSFDVELAYDSSIGKGEKTYTDIYMRWLGRGVDITKLSLKGRVEGGITGMIDVAGSGNSLSLGSLSFQAGTVKNMNTSVTVNQPSDAAHDVAVKSQNQVDKIIKAKLDKLAHDLLNKLVKNYLLSPLTEIFGSFLGGSNKNLSADNVNLKLAADISMNGTMELMRPVFTQPLKIPGTTYTPTSDLTVPHYDKPLGVLTLSATPEVTWEEWFEYALYGNEYCYLQKYSLNEGSFTVTLNPAVTDQLRIKSVQKFLYYYQTYQGSTKLVGILTRDPDYVGATLVDSDPENTLYQGSTALFTVYRNVLPIPYQGWERGAMTNGVDQKVVVRVVVELERLDDPTADPVVWSKTYRPRYTQDRSQNPVRYIDPFQEIFPLPK